MNCTIRQIDAVAIVAAAGAIVLGVVAYAATPLSFSGEVLREERSPQGAYTMVVRQNRGVPRIYRLDLTTDLKQAAEVASLDERVSSGTEVDVSGLKRHIEHQYSPVMPSQVKVKGERK